MQEKILTGEEALMVIQSYSVLKVIHEVLPKNLEPILETGYTEEMKKKMSKEAFTVIAISSELQKLGESMTKTIEDLTKQKGTAFKLEVTQFPEIKIQAVKEEEINQNKNAEVEKC